MGLHKGVSRPKNPTDIIDAEMALEQGTTFCTAGTLLGSLESNCTLIFE